MAIGRAAAFLTGQIPQLAFSGRGPCSVVKGFFFFYLKPEKANQMFKD